ncbi:hypothetical protein OAN307_c42940 [Octadecabacter antarcticus 307]|uniref:Uncharacterized protein n=1 Tax=Octadecabacter antarcticus 307 TaxID=391626 RepID=M9RGZ5_9RHOB|nr:hypothetical protein OAN307_c42940 [Octadecabacter antarcticus 307]
MAQSIVIHARTKKRAEVARQHKAAVKAAAIRDDLAIDRALPLRLNAHQYGCRSTPNLEQVFGSVTFMTFYQHRDQRN